MSQGSRACPFCAEPLEAAAAKCRHCGEAVDRTARPAAGGDPEHLRRVAARQRGVILCILLYLAAVMSQFALPPDLRPLLGLFALAVVVAATVFVFLLALELYSAGVGVLLATLTLIPCVGLLVLLRINARATEELKAHGLRVGLLGADTAHL